MLILNPEHLQATQQKLGPDPVKPARFAPAVRVVLAVATTMVAAFAGFSVTQYFAGLWSVWVAVAAIGGFVYLASLSAITVAGYSWHVPLGIIWGTSFALGLPWHAPFEAFTVALIIALSAIFAYLTYLTATGSFATLHIFTVARRYASLFSAGIVLGLVVLYGAALSRGTPLLPEGALAGIANQAALFVPTFVPALQSPSSSQTVSVMDLARASVTTQLQEDPRFKELDPEQQHEVIETAAKQAAASFSKQLGVASSSASSSIGTVTQGALSNVLNRFHDRYGWYFTIAWLLGAFFIARSVAFLLTIVVAGACWLTVSAAVSLGLLRVETIPSFRERLTL